jgi:hypothetical protein
MEKLNQLKLIELSEANLSSTKSDLYADGTLANSGYCYCYCYCSSCNCGCNSSTIDETEVLADVYNVTESDSDTLADSTKDNAADTTAKPSTSSTSSTSSTTTTTSSEPPHDTV